MALLDSSLKRELPQLYSNRDPRRAWVCARYYAPDKGIVWLVSEGSPDAEDFEFYGCVVSDLPRWGYFSLGELKAARKEGIRILRDKAFKKCRISKCLRAERGSAG